MELRDVQSILPELRGGIAPPPVGKYILVMAAGFEARTMHFLNRASNVLPGIALVIVYKGEAHSNRERAVLQFFADHGVPYDLLEFDRKKPQVFEDNLMRQLSRFPAFEDCLIDVSSMSKLLIMCILVNFRSLPQRLTVVYTEPMKYLPSESQFEKRKSSKSLGTSKLYFQTSDVSATVSTQGLSSVAMADAPRFLVAFPTFNEDLLITLFQEFSPHAWLIVHGVPLRDADAWRLDAIRYINRHVLSQVSSADQVTMSTYHYAETFALLEDYYQKYKLTHKFIVGPPVSKLQAVAVSLFKLYRQDVQILYPTPKSYLLKEHSELARSVHSISFGVFSEFVKELITHRHKSDAFCHEDLAKNRV